jgi:hypothetical protein
MIAHALLVVIAANEHNDRPAPAGMIPLTCSEIRRLFTVLVVEPRRVPLPASLVDLAPTPPTPRPNQPLQAPGDNSATTITIYGWSIRARPRRRVHLCGR